MLWFFVIIDNLYDGWFNKKMGILLINLGSLDVLIIVVFRIYLCEFLFDFCIVEIFCFIWMIILYCFVLMLCLKCLVVFYKSIWIENGLLLIYIMWE